MSRTKMLLVLAALGMAIILSGFMADIDIQTREALGEKLFFDPVLSGDRTVSCASCHNPAFAFADTSALSKGVNGTLTKRNTPGLTNLSGRPFLFWDGRASTLEEQARHPIINPQEMNLSMRELVQRLNADPQYRRAFETVFHAPADTINIVQAIAAFERTLETANSPYDRYINGEDEALSPEAIRGRRLFIGKANCNTCHSGEDFTADRFKNIGLYDGIRLRDTGRQAISGDSAYAGFFKIPGLRNVALTAPYMHNGMFKTLREVISYYNNPDAVIKSTPRRDLSLNQPLNLTDQEITDLEAFLVSLTDSRFN